MAGSTLQVTKPMSVKEIVGRAQEFDFNTFIALKYWLRTADTILREARIYEQEQNDQQAYLLLMRYAILVSEKFPHHPGTKDPENRVILKAATQTIPEVLNRLEVLKPRISARFNAWQQALERRRGVNAVFDEGRPHSSSRMDLAASDPAMAGLTTTLAAADNGHLAVELAHNEIKRRDAARKATRQAGVSEEVERERRTAGGVWDDWEAALSKDAQARRPNNEEELCRNLATAQRRLDGSHDILPDGIRSDLKRPQMNRQLPKSMKRNGTTEYYYPSISKAQPLHSGDVSSDIRLSHPPPLHAPPKPPKDRLEELQASDNPPPRPEKDALQDSQNLGIEDSNSAPSSFTFRPSAYLENGNPLRTVFLPPTLRLKFLSIAAQNTHNNLETCGVLCGTLISNALFISRLVIPEQESTSDTCETVNEGALFEYCSKEDLMVLGWIHTHPTQTCFMSSRDLHTHSGYQAMMPESIAIVCAPSKQPSWGIFRLTDPPGMKSVLQCTKPGIFHPHDEANIYTDALRPGHVFEAEGLEYEVVDLRP